MSTDQTFLMIFRPKRPDFVSTMTAEERSVMGAHAARCMELCAEGRAVTLGVCQDGAYGVFVFKAASPEQAREFFAGDPAVTAGIVDAELHPFMLAFPQAG